MNIRLDNRVIEGKMPLTWFDADKAKEFIGKTGYFSDNLICFKNIDNLKVDVLTGVDDDLNEEEIYQTNTARWIYFLPDEWVKPKEPEKKYRPYTVMEFIKYYPIGSHLHFRPKDGTMEMHRLIDGYNDCLNGAGTLFMCGAMYSMLELYDNYDIFRDGEWQPFGIEVKEEGE